MLKSRYYAWLIPYIEGTLDANRRHLLEKRMDADPKLALEMDALHRVTSHLRRSASGEPSPVDMPPVWPRVRSRLQKRGPAPLVSPRLVWGGAASIAVGFLLATNLRTDPQGYLPPVGEESKPARTHMLAMTPSSSAAPDNDEALKSPSAPALAPTSKTFTATNALAENSTDTPIAVTHAKLATSPARTRGNLTRLDAAPTASKEASLPLATMSRDDALSVVANASPAITPPRVTYAAPSAAFASNLNTIASKVSNGSPAPLQATVAGAAPILAMPDAFRMYVADARIDASHEALASSDAISGMGVNRFFIQLPHSARAIQRSMSPAATPLPPKALTAAQSVEALRAQAYAQQSHGQFSNALDTWRDAVFVSLTAPTYSDETAVKQAYETLGVVQKFGLLDNLRNRLEQQEAFAPDDIVSMRALGYLYMKTGDVELARGVWRKVTQSGTETGEDWYQLAGAELINGDTTAARVAYERAVRPGALPLTSSHRATAESWLGDSLH